MEEEIDHQDDLKMSAETDIDIVYLTETTEISKEESLKIFQSIVSFYCLKCLR
jgi:RNase P subunit RPR2